MRKKTTLFFPLIFSFFSCGSDNADIQKQADEAFCVPGESISCTCTNGLDGAQACSSEGNSYGDCICENEQEYSSTPMHSTDEESTTNETSAEETSSPTTDGSSTTHSTSGQPLTTGNGSETDDLTGTSGNDSTGEETDSIPPQSLIVEANGERIGYLLLVEDYSLYVWDDVNDIRFHINDETGYLSGVSGGQFENETCSGYGLGIVASVNACEEATSVNHPYVFGWGGDSDGFILSEKALIVSGTPTLREIQSIQGTNECIDYTEIEYYTCAVELKETDLVSTSFPLPITISQQ